MVGIEKRNNEHIMVGIALEVVFEVDGIEAPVCLAVRQVVEDRSISYIYPT